MPFNNDAAFLDRFWRFAHRSAPDGEIRAYQNMAHGAGPYLFINGDIDQYDENGLKGARPAFQFHKDHEELYVRQESAARVLLLETGGVGGGSELLYAMAVAVFTATMEAPGAPAPVASSTTPAMVPVMF